jgi:metal-responsive CopG/Arc/MetJ family transcriptional regulator
MYFGDSDSMRIYLDLNEEIVEKVEAYAKTKPFNMSRSAAINEILDRYFASENRT